MAADYGIVAPLSEEDLNFGSRHIRRVAVRIRFTDLVDGARDVTTARQWLDAESAALKARLAASVDAEKARKASAGKGGSSAALPEDGGSGGGGTMSHSGRGAAASAHGADGGADGRGGGGAGGRGVGGAGGGVGGSIARIASGVEMSAMRFFITMLAELRRTLMNLKAAGPDILSGPIPPLVRRALAPQASRHLARSSHMNLSRPLAPPSSA